MTPWSTATVRAIEVDVGDRPHHERRVAMATQQRAHGERDVAHVEAGRGHLVEQRLERVEVVLVDEGDAYVGVAERAHHSGAPEPCSDDDDVWPLGARDRHRPVQSGQALGSSTPTIVPIANTAPVGSCSTAITPTGVSNGGATTPPPNADALSTASCVPSTAK